MLYGSLSEHCNALPPKPEILKHDNHTIKCEIDDTTFTDDYFYTAHVEPNSFI